MNSDKTSKVCIFGGSFNPPHVGHSEICRYILEKGLAGEVWVIPCYAHPFGKVLAPFEDRLEMCRIAFKEFGNKAQVLDVEKQLGGVSHTIKTIKHLKEKNPSTEFMLVVGKDVANEKDNWKDYDQIKELVTPVEVPRGPDSHITDISSSTIRDMIGKGEKFQECVTSGVAVYIAANELYKS